MEPRLLWTPPAQEAENANIRAYAEWLATTRGLQFDSWASLWQWSVDHADEFWKTLLEYFGVVYEGHYKHVVTGSMPHAHWFRGVSLNYAENIFAHASEYPAIIFSSESEAPREISWTQLREQAGSLSHFLRTHGVEKGDRVAAFLPNIPEATVAMLASVSLGAIWSSCSPDFGLGAVIDRFAQIEPTVLVAADHYQYGGKVFDKTDLVRDLVRALPSLRCVIFTSEKKSAIAGAEAYSWKEATRQDHALQFLRVPFDHPLWILYSSGTTGLPKAITHSHGGILLEQLKYGTFHNDFKSGERCFWYSTTGWMMWNYIHGSLLAGATMVLYDGSPAHPSLESLWKLAQDVSINHFGTSAAFILSSLKAGVAPCRQFDLSSLRSISSTGSTLPPEGFDWIYNNVKSDVWLASMSGGTDVCSAFVGGNPTLPVYAGEIQCRALGCSLEAWDEEGRPVTGAVGEMVITRPMPSMPVFFWNDPDYTRYTESYFEMFPGVWRHGDWIEVTPRDGIIIYGRSDATLNRSGIRIGTSEIYRAVDQVEEVRDSLIVCLEKQGGQFWMPLFVVMREAGSLNDAIRQKINLAIRSAYSPRHVPDEIIEVPDVPYTISGKKTETPVKKVLMGKDPAKVVSMGSLRNAASLDFFIALARTQKDL